LAPLDLPWHRADGGKIIKIKIEKGLAGMIPVALDSI
jgi:hypothetical protein